MHLNASFNISTKLFAATCLLLLFVFSSVAFLGRTANAAAPTVNSIVLYVSPTGSDTTGSGSFASPYATITHAVAQAASFYASSKNASTIIVRPGTYDEMVVITTPIDLISANGMPLSTIINATGLANGIVVVGQSAAGSVVEGFATINANNHGIFVQDSSNVRVENNLVSNNGLNVQAGLGEDKAIQLAGASDSAIVGNTIVGNLYGGAGITDDGAIDPSWNATAAPGSNIPAGTPNPGNNDTISGNMIINNRPNHCAIVVSAYDQGEGVSNNVVSDNVVVDNQNGIIVAADTPNTVANNNTVINNNIVDNGEGGVIIHNNSPGDVVKGNVIMNNFISGDGYLPTLEGVIVGGEGPVAALNTVIEGNTFQNEAIGVQVVNGNNTMVGGNTMDATVKLAYNGTVTQTSTGTGGISSPTTVTIAVTQTSTVSVAPTSVGAVTQTVTSTALPLSTTITTLTTTTTSTSGGISFDLGLLTAVATLIVGLVAGMIARPIRESAGR
jgi:hypothetical protein